jgi:hypothetical protein
LGVGERLAGDHDDQQDKVWRRSFIVNYLGSWKADIVGSALSPGLVHSSICHQTDRAAEHRISLSLPGVRLFVA